MLHLSAENVKIDTAMGTAAFLCKKADETGMDDDNA